MKSNRLKLLSTKVNVDVQRIWC